MSYKIQFYYFPPTGFGPTQTGHMIVGFQQPDGVTTRYFEYNVSQVDGASNVFTEMDLDFGLTKDGIFREIPDLSEQETNPVVKEIAVSAQTFAQLLAFSEQKAAASVGGVNYSIQTIENCLGYANEMYKMLAITVTLH